MQNQNVRKNFPGIAPRAFQHPEDRQALEALTRVPLFPQLLKRFWEFLPEQAFRLLNLSDNVRISSKQCPSLYSLYLEATRILDIQDPPELFLNATYQINALSFGMERFTITLHSGLVDFLTEEELLAVIGHELGHVKCEHMLYKGVADLLLNAGFALILPLLGEITRFLTLGIRLALLDWYRKAELSCDRAALLVVQDPEIVASALAKLAGGSPKLLPSINMDEVLSQAREYYANHEPLSRTIKLLQTIGVAHPYPVVRAYEIMNWGASQEYTEILGGRYLKVDKAPPAPARATSLRSVPGVREVAASSRGGADDLFEPLQPFQPFQDLRDLRPPDGDLRPEALGAERPDDRGEESTEPTGICEACGATFLPHHSSCPICAAPLKSKKKKKPQKEKEAAPPGPEETTGTPVGSSSKKTGEPRRCPFCGQAAQGRQGFCGTCGAYLKSGPT